MITYPYPRPTDPEKLIKAIKFIFDTIRSIFMPPKPNETPEDTAKRYEQRQVFCNYIKEQAKQLEDSIIAELKQYAAYFDELQKGSSRGLLAQHNIRVQFFTTQIDNLCSQIPVIVESEASKRISETDPEFKKILWMLPGAEKEAAMRNFTHSVIQSAVEKCAVQSEQIIDGIETEFILQLQEAQEHEETRLKKKIETLATLQKEGDTSEKEVLCSQASLVCFCCSHVEELLQMSKREED